VVAASARVMSIAASFAEGLGAASVFCVTIAKTLLALLQLEALLCSVTNHVAVFALRGAALVLGVTLITAAVTLELGKTHVFSVTELLAKITKGNATLGFDVSKLGAIRTLRNITIRVNVTLSIATSATNLGAVTDVMSDFATILAHLPLAVDGLGISGKRLGDLALSDRGFTLRGTTRRG